MATTTVPKTSDTRTSDWREALGLTEHPDPGHVHGATALSQQEWRQRAHRQLGHRFVVLYADVRMTRRVDSLPKSYENAQADLAYGERSRAEAYHPHSGRSLTVMAEEEWQRVMREGRA
jgi:hypothetical protein